MALRRILLLAGVLMIPVSCMPFDHEKVERPPESADAAVEWWKTTIEKAPLEFLAAFTEATDLHRKRGTSATYEVLAIPLGKAAGTPDTVSYRLPCPSPPGA